MPSFRNADVPPRRLRQLRKALVEFRSAYTAYLDATLRSRGGSGDETGKLRRAVSATIPAATEAMRAARYEFVIYPPPAAGPRAPVVRGLRNTAFAHETPIGYTGMMGGRLFGSASSTASSPRSRSWRSARPKRGVSGGTRCTGATGCCASSSGSRRTS